MISSKVFFLVGHSGESQGNAGRFGDSERCVVGFVFLDIDLLTGHFQVDRDGLDHPAALLTPAGGDHLVDEVQFDFIGRFEASDVALEHVVEFCRGLVGEHEGLGGEAVTDRVHRRVLDALRRLGACCLCSISLYCLVPLSRLHLLILLFVIKVALERTGMLGFLGMLLRGLRR